MPNNRKTSPEKQLKRWQDSFLYIWKNIVNLFLCAAMKVRELLELELHIFLTSILDGGEWSTSHTGALTVGKVLRALGDRVGLDTLEKIALPYQESKQDPSAHSLGISSY